MLILKPPFQWTFNTCGQSMVLLLSNGVIEQFGNNENA